MKSKYGYYKVASANFVTRVGEINKNAEEINRLVLEAIKEGVNVLTFPELAFSGYTAQDLFFHSELIDEELKEIEKLLKIIPETLVTVIGGIFKYLDKLYDVAFVLSNHKLLGIVPKSYLPNYNEFYEKRWFSAGKNIKTTNINLFNESVPFGTDLIFDFGEMKLGVEICEDLWVINPPSNSLCLNGANLIVNPSASNEYIGKREYREELVKLQSAKNYCAYVYASSGFGESTQDVVFSGHQIIASGGVIINESYDQKGLTIGLVDINKLSNDRIKFKTALEEETSNSYRYISSFNDAQVDYLPSEVNAYPFILSDKEKRFNRSLEIISLQAKGLATRLFNSHFKDVVIGISGGLDSTLAIVVINEAFKMLNLDFKGIHALTLPGFATSKTTAKNVKNLLKALNIDYKTINISALATKHLKDLNHPLDEYDIAYENTQARIRTLYLMDYANMVNGLVIGTGDLSELALGFATYNGDHMSMYGVNASVPKTLIKILLEDYSLKYPELKKVIKDIIDTPISPELIPSSDKNIGQKTEQILGKYDLHDFFLYHFIRNSFTKEKIFELAKIAFKDVDEKYIAQTLETFMKRFFSQQFKRSCLPDGPKVGSVALSPRGDLRLSSDIAFDNSISKINK